MVVLGVVLCFSGFAPGESEDDGTVQWVCREHPRRVGRLFESLDLGREDLAAVRRAVARGDRPAACRAIIEYYRRGTGGTWLRGEVWEARERPVSRTDSRAVQLRAEAAKILDDVYTCGSLEAKIPRLSSGRLNWAYGGPNDSDSFAGHLNTQMQLNRLLLAYFKTRDPVYARRIDEDVRDWILSNPYPGKEVRPQWNALEASARSVRWGEVFFGLLEDEAFSPATRILLLSSLPDHAFHLQHFHKPYARNQILNAMAGLAGIAAAWRQFKDAPQWLDYATDVMTKQVAIQVYPDGAHKELSSGYHLHAAQDFEGVAESLHRADASAPGVFASTVERMWNHLLYCMRPNGLSTLNNDTRLYRLRDRGVHLARRYGRPDWAYVATNGKKGEAPQGPPSIVFPWAGHVVMRSGWDKDAHWAFFDVGPFGVGHQHADKLHLSVSAHGRDLLVDSAVSNYDPDKWFAYFRSSEAHNVVLIDGHGQSQYEKHLKEASEPIPADTFAVAPEFDYARGVYAGPFKHARAFGKKPTVLEGEATHTRAVVYVRGKFWVVVDRVTSDRRRTLEVPWHYHPDCTVTVENGSATSTDVGKGNLRIVPAGKLVWQVSVVKGQNEPYVQGWYSKRYQHREPNPTVVYSGRFDKAATFAWVLLPARGRPAAAEARIVEENEAGAGVRIELPGERAVTVSVPLTAGEPGIEPAD